MCVLEIHFNKFILTPGSLTQIKSRDGPDCPSARGFPGPNCPNDRLECCKHGKFLPNPSCKWAFYVYLPFISGDKGANRAWFIAVVAVDRVDEGYCNGKDN